MAIDKICQFADFGDDVDLILLAEEIVSKLVARGMVLKTEAVRGDSTRTAERLRGRDRIPRLTGYEHKNLAPVNRDERDGQCGHDSSLSEERYARR